MKVDSYMIKKELRIYGAIASLMIKPTEKSFRRMNKMSRKKNGVNIKGLQNDERWINGREENHKIRVRIHKPINVEGELPGILYLHGGGYAINTPESEGTSIKEIIEKRDCIVVAPDYCLSTEKPYPAALNDCYDTLLWMKENSKELGINDNQLVVYGGSAGAGLAAALCLYARDDKKVNIAFQILLYPMIDDRMTSDSMIDNNAPVWNVKHTELAWNMYLKGLDKDNIPIYAAPSRAKDLSNLPPAFSFVGDIDPFHDETIEYFQRLKESGVPAEYKVFDKCYHAFEQAASNTEIAKEAKKYILDKFSYGIDNYFATDNDF